jgi:hypothetical protein
MVLLTGLKTGVPDLLNPDDSGYIDVFNKVPMLWNFTFTSISGIYGEVGYLFICSLIKSLGLGYRFAFLFIGLISVGISIKYYLKYSPYIIISLLIYFSHTFLLKDLIIIRSGLAASITLYSIPHIENRKFWKFFKIILIASCFHIAALILIIAYFVHGLVVNNVKRQIFLLGLGIVLGLFLSATVLTFIFSSILNIPIISAYMLDSNYFTSLTLLNPVLIKNIVLAVLLIVFAAKLRNRVPYYDAMTTLSILSATWLATFNNFAIIASRLGTFFSIGEPIVIPVLLLSVVRFNKVLAWILVVFYCIMLFSDKGVLFNSVSFSLN